MAAENLASIAGVILSLGFSYIPGLNTKYAGLDGIYKRLIMAGMLVIVAGSVYGLSCAGIWPGNLPNVTCDQNGIQGLISAFVAALIANQGAYSLSPESKAVTRAKNGRYESPVG